MALIYLAYGLRCQGKLQMVDPVQFRQPQLLPSFCSTLACLSLVHRRGRSSSRQLTSSSCWLFGAPLPASPHLVLPCLACPARSSAGFCSPHTWTQPGFYPQSDAHLSTCTIACFRTAGWAGDRAGRSSPHLRSRTRTTGVETISGWQLQLALLR